MRTRASLNRAKNQERSRELVMILKQYFLGCLAHASYLVGDKASGTAIVVDTQGDIQKYLSDAADFGMIIRHVFLTHFHADFIAGHLELRDLGTRAQAEYAFTPMNDGDMLHFLGLRLQVLETPGHTIESLSILVFDRKRDPARPHVLLTGDTLLIGDVGRPDLRTSLGWTASDLGARLYDSLHQKLLTLPGETLVYPAHGAGSPCGKQLSSETVSSLERQRRTNYALQPMTKKEFIRLVTADQPDAPPHFTCDAVLNTREHTNLDENLDRMLHSIELDEVLRIGDGRRSHPDPRFARSGRVRQGSPRRQHQYRAQSPIRDLGRHSARPPQTRRDHRRAWTRAGSRLRLGRIGFDHVRGRLGGGMGALADRLDPGSQWEAISSFYREEWDSKYEEYG
jgi:glyoxylase-like metal-dependent hydrolase (beta-lactamase superfamily II)